MGAAAAAALPVAVKMMKALLLVVALQGQRRDAGSPAKKFP